jgi:hypothetical protein
MRFSFSSALAWWLARALIQQSVARCTPTIHLLTSQLLCTYRRSPTASQRGTTGRAQDRKKGMHRVRPRNQPSIYPGAAPPGGGGRPGCISNVMLARPGNRARAHFCFPGSASSRRGPTAPRAEPRVPGLGKATTHARASHGDRGVFVCSRAGIQGAAATASVTGQRCRGGRGRRATAVSLFSGPQRKVSFFLLFCFDFRFPPPMRGK